MQSYQWNASGILIPDKSLEWARGTVGPAWLWRLYRFGTHDYGCDILRDPVVQEEVCNHADNSITT